MAFLLALPSSIYKVNADSVAPPFYWSPFGPFQNQLILTTFTDFSTMFTHYSAGEVDITDWPILTPAAAASFTADAGSVVTNEEPEFGIFEFEYNSHNSFLGIQSLTTRTTAGTPPGILSTSFGSACGVGAGRLVVNLVNGENSDKAIKDTLNKVSVTGPQSFSVLDDGGSTPTGTYTLPSSSTCMTQGTYTISSSVFAGTASLNVCPMTGCVANPPGTVVTVTFRVNFNSISTQKLTDAGTNIRQGLAHLLNKPDFMQATNVQGRALCDDLFGLTTEGIPFGSCDAGAAPGTNGCLAPPVGTANCHIPQAILDDGEVGAGSAHTWNAASLGSAYRIDTASLGGSNYFWGATGNGIGANHGYPGVDDIRAACDHLLLAGFKLSDNTKTCQDVANALNSAVNPGAYVHLCQSVVAGVCQTGKVSAIIRTHKPRKEFGQIIADGINALFGTPNNGGTINYDIPTNNQPTPKYFSFGQAAPIVFDTTNKDDWNIYTGGFGLGSVPNQYFGFISEFATDACGGVAQVQPSNYYMYCNPEFDSQAKAGNFSPAGAGSPALAFPAPFGIATQFFVNAGIVAHKTVLNVPVFSKIHQFVALKAWSFQGSANPTRSSLVAGLGVGWEAGTTGNFWSPLNMRCNTAFAAPAGQACGGGTAGLIRQGLSQEIDQFSPLAAISVWDFSVVNQVFDTLLTTNPETSPSTPNGLQVLDWMTSKHFAVSFDPNEVSCLPASLGGTCTLPGQGTTTLTFHLRNDLKFHDGTQVTAADIVFSLLAARDVPSANAFPSVAFMTAATALNPTTVQVKYQFQSAFYPLQAGGIPIIPGHGPHSWVPACSFGGVLFAPGNQCASPAFDPSVAGIMVGSGPWACKDITTGAVGGICSQNADGSVGSQFVHDGGRVLLTANSISLGLPGYMRSGPGVTGSSLHKAMWSDKDHDGGGQNKDILDVSSAAFVFGTGLTGDTVVYDTNSNVQYNAGEPVIGNGDNPPAQPPAPANLTPLKSDAKLKFVDTDGNGIWDPGETVVYDTNGNGVYNTGEPVIGNGTPAFPAAPANLTPLTSDPKVRFVDPVNLIWRGCAGNAACIADVTYWNNPLFGTDPARVDIGEISTLGFYFDHSITGNIAPGALTSVDPNINYCQPAGQCTSIPAP